VDSRELYTGSVVRGDRASGSASNGEKETAFITVQVLMSLGQLSFQTEVLISKADAAGCHKLPSFSKIIINGFAIMLYVSYAISLDERGAEKTTMQRSKC
jgi:hypothetical protein